MHMLHMHINSSPWLPFHAMSFFYIKPLPLKIAAMTSAFSPLLQRVIHEPYYHPCFVPSVPECSLLCYSKSFYSSGE